MVSNTTLPPSLPPTGGKNNLTILRANDHPLAKRYYKDENGCVKTSAFQNAYRYKASSVRIRDIYTLARLLKRIAKHPYMAIIRGLHREGKDKNAWREQHTFPDA
jgi:hypothetical protein